MADENSIFKQVSPEDMSDEERKWRLELIVGSKVDALKIDPMHKVACWCPASVSQQLLSADGDKVVISFENDASLSSRALSIYSPDLAV